MNITLNNLKDVTGECCVTIILTTHRTLPDNAKDSIHLKNLQKDAERRIQAECDKETALVIIDRLNKLAAEIDHRHNLESLVLFVNEDIAEYTRLPLKVEDRVVVDETFHTRDLMRALNKESGYYILLLSRHKTRMIEALSDKVVRENDSLFPVESDITTVPPEEKGSANRVTGLHSGWFGNMRTAYKNKFSWVTGLQIEFFNNVDKMVNEVYKENPLPVIVCTGESNYSEYIKVANNKEIYIDNIPGNKLMDQSYHVVDAVWPTVKEIQTKKNQKRIGELDAAVNRSHFVTDFNDIWSALNEGRGRTLFVKQGYFQPARIVDERIQLVAPGDAEEPDVVDDIIDEMLEKTVQNGGDAVFMYEDELDKFQGLVLVTRY